MSNAKHTPGPWRVEVVKARPAPNVHIRGPRHELICEMWKRDDVDGNARLVSQAPALLLAVKDLLANIADETMDSEVADFAREVVAQCEGTSTIPKDYV